MWTLQRNGNFVEGRMTPTEQEIAERLIKVGMGIDQLMDCIIWAISKLRSLEKENAEMRQILKG